MSDFDLVIRGGTVATATDTFSADIAVRDGRIVTLGEGLPEGRQEIDASGRLVLPGGVDSHAHIEQLSANGMMNADTFESATGSAALGGTTTVISFAAQHVGMSLRKVVDEYHEAADRGAIIDYAFHMILADPRPEILEDELPSLVAEGHSSLKVFTTYDRLRVQDEQLLDVLEAARRHGCMVCVHAENHGMVSWMGKRLVERGYTAPRYHAVSHPRLCEPEAVSRVIACAALLDQPVMLYHISTAEALEVIRRAQGQGQKVFAETCTQYLTMTKKDLDRPGMEGAMWMCSPPLRERSDQEALWRALANGTLQTVSSDHAPYRMDETGKLARGPNAAFKEIANGMPGLELRLPVLFDAMVSKGRMDVNRFVDLTATAPAKLYGLHPRKGSIAVGADADIVVWDTEREVTIEQGSTHDDAGYTPFVGHKVKGWPATVLRRGEVVAEQGALRARPGSGTFLARQGGPAAQPSGRLAAEFDPERNFGAELY
ncbi:dihydropyrimidinase [Geminicoccaceae bacterium 1502E]|nr:dihydropyrimidinase [Geminicoccaceae bacterium 1502E]